MVVLSPASADPLDPGGNASDDASDPDDDEDDYRPRRPGYKKGDRVLAQNPKGGTHPWFPATVTTVYTKNGNASVRAFLDPSTTPVLPWHYPSATLVPP